MDTALLNKKPSFKQNPILIRGETLKWKLENMLTWDGSLKYSDPFVVDKMKWKIGMEKIETKLKIYVELSSCELESRAWILDASFGVKLYMRNGNFDHDFEYETDDLQYFGGCEKQDPSNMHGFFKPSGETQYIDLVMVEVFLDVTVFDFTSKIPNIPTVMLKVEDVVFHFNKYLLSSISEYFFELFNETETDNRVIEVKDVDVKQFATFLGSICPISLDINEHNFDYLLKLAEKFGVTSLPRDVENYIVDYSEMDTMEKVKYAEKYDLKYVLNDCILSFESAKDVKKFTQNNDFYDLKDETKLIILRTFLIFPMEQFNELYVDANQ